MEPKQNCNPEPIYRKIGSATSVKMACKGNEKILILSSKVINQFTKRKEKINNKTGRAKLKKMI